MRFRERGYGNGAARAMLAAVLLSGFAAPALAQADFIATLDRLDARMAALGADGSPPVLRSPADIALFDAATDRNAIPTLPTDLGPLNAICKKLDGIFQRFLAYAGNDPATRFPRWAKVEKQAVPAIVSTDLCFKRAIHSLFDITAGFTFEQRLKLAPAAGRIISSRRLQMTSVLMMLGEATTSAESRALLLTTLFEDVDMIAAATPPAERIAFRTELRAYAGSHHPAVRDAAGRLIRIFTRTDCDSSCRLVSGLE